MNICPACATPTPSPEHLTLLACPKCAVRFLPQGNTHVFVFTDVGGQEQAAGRPELSPEFRAAYALGRVLGVGGQATVYEARDRRTGASVAVKFLTRLADDEHLKRFLREFELLQAIDSPHVVRVLALGEADGYPYLISELLTGGSLAALLAKGPLAPRDAAPLMADVLAGLEACHARGIVHRDLKPANVLLDGAGRAKLADLGIAKATTTGEAKLTQPGMILGTIAYMAPEHLLGEAVTPASDVYAAGMLLHEVLLGRLPMPKISIPDVVDFHQRKRSLGLGSEVSPAVAELLERALATDVGRRPKDARAFADELEGALARSSGRTAAGVPAPAAPRAAHADTALAPIPGAGPVPPAETVRAPISSEARVPQAPDAAPQAANPHFFPAIVATALLVSTSIGISFLKIPGGPEVVRESSRKPAPPTPSPTERVVQEASREPPAAPVPESPAAPVPESPAAPVPEPATPPAPARTLPRFEAAKLERTPWWIAHLERMVDRRSARSVPGRGADYSGVAITTAYGVPYSERRTFDAVYSAVVLFGRALAADTGRPDLLVGQESLDPAITYLLPDPDSVDRILAGEEPAVVARAGRGAIETGAAPASGDRWWTESYPAMEKKELATVWTAKTGDTVASVVGATYAVPRANVEALERIVAAVLKHNAALKRLLPGAPAFVTVAPLERGAKYYLPDARSVGRLLKGDDADLVVRDALEEPQNRALAR